MSTKHTPAPWTIHSGDPLQVIASDGYQVDICSCYDYCRPVPTDHKQGEGEANARLIAAAPELLAASKAKLDAEKAIQEHVKDCPYCRCGERLQRHCRAIKELKKKNGQETVQLESAIAKAEGKVAP